MSYTSDPKWPVVSASIAACVEVGLPRAAPGSTVQVTGEWQDGMWRLYVSELPGGYRERAGELLGVVRAADAALRVRLGQVSPGGPGLGGDGASIADPRRVELWFAINDYVTTCGGDASRGFYGNRARMEAVKRVEQCLAAMAAEVK